MTAAWSAIGATLAKESWTSLICVGFISTLLMLFVLLLDVVSRRSQQTSQLVAMPELWFEPGFRIFLRSSRLDEAMPLVEEFEHALPALQVGGIARELEPLARARQRHLQHLADPRAWPVGHHHDAVRQEYGLVDVVGDHQDGVAELLVQGHHRVLEVGPG